MVEIKYGDQGQNNARVLIPSMTSGQTVTLQSHGYKMPGNFFITTDPGYLKPTGQKLVDILPGEEKTVDIKTYETVKIVASALENAKYEGEFTIS